MDELKLEKWKKDFNAKAENIWIEFAPFFKNKDSDDYYELKLDESSEFFLEFKNKLSDDVQQRLEKILAETKPEDSV